MRKIINMTILAISIVIMLLLSLQACSQKSNKSNKSKDSTYFMSTEDTLFNNAQERGVGAVMMVVHRDYKCTVAKSNSPSKTPITECSYWYTYTKAFRLTDTGWKIIK